MPTDIEKLKERFQQEINSRKFNFLEMKGFEANPNMALMAGVAIGYEIGITDSLNTFDKAMREKGKEK